MNGSNTRAVLASMAAVRAQSERHYPEWRSLKKNAWPQGCLVAIAQQPPQGAAQRRPLMPMSVRKRIELIDKALYAAATRSSDLKSLNGARNPAASLYHVSALLLDLLEANLHAKTLSIQFSKQAPRKGGQR
jgi:hypothetical protein